MPKEFFTLFNFFFGVNRLVFLDVIRPVASEGASLPENGKLLDGGENAHENVDILAEIAKTEGGAALNAARQEAARLRLAGGGKLQDESQAMFDKLSTQGSGAASQVSSPAHGNRHTQNVLKNAMEIATEIAKEHSNLNTSLAHAAAIWHDTGRLHDPDNHEALGALMVHNEALKLGFSLETATKLFNAILHHNWKDQPKTLEGHIVRDADKLDSLDGVRWTQRIRQGNLEKLESSTKNLLGLRSSLHLDVSKRIFDRRLPAFLDFMATVQDEIFLPMKVRIMSAFDLV